MGKAYRKHAMEILTLLKEMQGKVQKAVRHKNIKIAGQLLAESQEAAIVLGNSIEAYLGERSDTVKAIEEYCEAVYQLHTALQEKSGVDGSLRELYSQWQKIRDFAEEELPDRYEMVFLPYKVSMWDSLESVWRAAEEDPDCDAYVIPIPYYDKNPNGTFRSEHYEGGDFPEDVPVTHYLEYDLEKRHPDIAFIHNPYDDRNFVTSVHPYFYSANLKKYVEKLVYIPYYISAEINPDSRDAIEGKAGMTLTNGVLNADMVFLQSENTKKLFVNILSEYIPKVKRSYWENKIWGLGSPKLDRVNRVVRDDTRLPQDWHEIIYTESGQRKKVVFYNISISTLLKNPDMLNKIRDVLQFFKNCKEAALWWRPHPLYESTLASMRPDMLSEYQQMVNQYKREGWGIFDDGVDLQWAIAETDAYYGDKSSVVQLFKEAEKPVMIQDATVRTQREIKAEDIPIWPSVFCVDGDDIWFIHGIANILMRYSISENCICVIGIIPDEEMFNGPLYKGIYKWKEKLFLIPSGARAVSVYDIAEEKYEKIPVDNAEKFIGSALFGKIYAKENYLYCMPFVYEAILKIDMENNHVEYIACKKEAESYIGDSTRIEDRIVAVYTYTNRAMVFDMKSDQISYVWLGKPSRQYTQIANAGTKIYLFDQAAHKIVKISEDNYSKEMWEISGETVKLTTASPNLILLNIADNYEMQMIDGEGNQTFYRKEEQAVKPGSLYSPFFTGIESDSPIQSDSFFYFSRVTYTMFQFRGNNLEKQISLPLTCNELERIKKQLVFLENTESSENDIYGLEIWLNGLKRRQDTQQKERLSSGEKILQVAKEKLSNGN